MNFGVGELRFGVGKLRFGVRTLRSAFGDSGIRVGDLGFGVRESKCGIGNLDLLLERRDLVPEISALVSVSLHLASENHFFSFQVLKVVVGESGFGV